MIEVAKSLTVGQTNTPLDARTRIDALADMETIPNPFLGMIVYCIETAQHYKITALKPKQIGALTVPNAAVDTFAPFSASDPSNTLLSPGALALGKDSVVGGYMANVDDINAENFTLTLTSLDTEPLDPEKYVVGESVYLAHNPLFNDPAALEILTVTPNYAEDEVTVENIVLAVIPPAEFTMPTINEDMRALAIVADPDCDTTAFSAGQNNVVSGESAGSHGSYNLVAGIASHSFGVGNSLFGDMLYVTGSGNLVEGSSLTVDGVSNVVKGMLNGVSGNSNTVNGQGLYVLGEMINMDGVNGMAVGRSITMSDCNLSVAIGTQLTVTAKSSITAGYKLTNAADHSMLVGRYGELTKEAKNEGAFIVAGGEHNAPLEVFAVRSRKNVLNPLYNSALDPQNTGTDSTGERQYLPEPAARTTYAGQLTPKAQSVTLSGSQTVTIDADKYSRVILAGTGTATFTLENWQDGDKCELVIDTSAITPVIPIAWIMPDIDLTADPRLYVLEIAQIGTSIFVAIKYPDIAESGASDAELSEHVADMVRHITSTERTNWNAKADAISDYAEILTTSGTYTPSYANGDFIRVILSGNMTIFNPTTIPSSGKAMQVEVTTGSHVLTVGSSTYSNGVFLLHYYRSGTNIRRALMEVI